jgi:hypothetical protein
VVGILGFLAVMLAIVCLWNFIVGMWIVGIITLVMTLWCSAEAITLYNEESYW